MLVAALTLVTAVAPAPATAWGRPFGDVPAPAFAGQLPALPAPVFFRFEAADAMVGEVAVLAAPDAAAATTAVLSNPTREGYPLAFLVEAVRADFLQVRLPMRPNGSLGWIRRSDVVLRPVANRVVIELEARRLTVFHGNQALFQSTVAVGRPALPTPTGDFYVDLVAHPGGGAYGVTLLSVAGFSDVLQTFGGGPGQIAIHGTNQPGLIGQAVSHGCVRMTNEDIVQVEELAPVGTPVTIVP